MTHHQVPQAGAADPITSAPRVAPTTVREAQQPVRPRPSGTRMAAPRSAGYSAAFGVGSGAAVVLRDLAIP